MGNTVGSFGSLYLGVNNRAVRNLRNSLVLSSQQKSFIYGTMLGDGSIIGNQDNKQKNYRLQIGHSIKQKELVLWKYEILKKFVIKSPSYRKINNSLVFRTISHPQITEIYNFFYKNSKKVLPSNIEDILKDKLSLAVWFMDDGGIARYSGKIQGYYLNTQSFNLKENQKLVRLFEKAYGLKVYILKNKGNHRLYFGSQARNLFRQLIVDRIIPSLNYKIIGTQI